jgi:hypothetical protein
LLQSDALAPVGGTTWPAMLAVRPRAMLVRLRRAVRRTPTSTVAVELVVAA